MRALMCASLLSSAILAGCASAADPAGPLVTVVSRGGLCAGAGGRGGACGWMLTIDEHGIHVPGRAPVPVPPPVLERLRAAIGRLRPAAVIRRPFHGTCPTAWDGQERVFVFRGVATPLPECRYDLRGVEAVEIVERLLGPG